MIMILLSHFISPLMFLLDIPASMMEYGCDDYIIKPFTPFFVKEIVHNMTEWTKMGNE